MQYRCLQQVRNDLFAGNITMEQLVADYLLRIQSQAHLHAFLEVFEHDAIEQARQLDRRIHNGENTGRLAGMVIGIKDNISIKNKAVTASSRILQGYQSIYHATAIERLLAEDAIIVGRLNCDEFAMGSSNENSSLGPTLNPIDERCVPGGSSGGSAAAVAANLCLAALGSDTGGSIRQPAAFCGVVGLKPTYGRISRYGLLAYGSSFDQIGPLTHTVEDAALLLEIMAGKDAKDATSSSRPVPSSTLASQPLPHSKFGVPLDVLNNPNLQPDVKKALDDVIEHLKSQGHTVQTVSFPYLDYLVPTYYILSTAEASSNLSRYDGIHYGYRSPHAQTLDEVYKKSRSEGFGKEVKRRIMLGTFVLSSGYYDAYYTKAQRVRRLIRNATLDIFQQVDFILQPTTPGTAFRFGQRSDDPVRMYLEDIFTVQANLAGVPAISVPYGMDTQNLPIGIQVMSNDFTEASLLQAASLLESFNV
ncbi:MAG: Asp-tRNA(Asn)/Glu-tRNA(Gln) amidotransferase subunit GatA [Candidatus Competibacteraceae bacterium]|nr:Asp-tRNA(Asn)/Glu-tRNA(Gln) amidotransferase subunit GatA [Candidatus Competibacteraceae bacterium]